MKTLTAERKEKFEEAIMGSAIFGAAAAGLQLHGSVLKVELQKLVDTLVLASFSRAERQAGRDSEEEPNAELMRGDWREYPENLWKIAECLRDKWMFVLPPKPQKKSEKSHYSFYVMAMEDLKIACGEFGVKVLEDLHTDWRAGFKNGIAPYTIPHPNSLVNVATGKAREMRDNGAPREENRKEYQKVVAVEEPSVPNPNRIKL